MKAVAEFMSNWWLVPIGLLVLVAIAVAFGKLLISDRKADAFYALAAIVVAVVVVPQVWVKIGGDSAPPVASGCTATSNCDAQANALVSVPSGKRVCFDPTFWSNLPRLGFHTSYRGSAEKRYGCTKETVLAGTCNETMGDSFRFKPESSVSLPRYWFVPDGGSNC